jgi:hypothetical protein
MNRALSALLASGLLLAASAGQAQQPAGPTLPTTPKAWSGIEVHDLDWSTATFRNVVEADLKR